jgi:hypothetical protein
MMKAICLVLVAGLTLVMASSAEAAAIAWTNAGGSNAAFDWSNGDSGDGQWGDPDVYPSGFYFNNMLPTFKAGPVTNPNADSIVSSMSVDIDASAPITELHFSESGTYTGDVADVRTVDTGDDVKTFASVLLTVLDPLDFINGPVFEAGFLDFTFHANGTWDAALDLGLADLTALSPSFAGGLNTFSIAVTNHLMAVPDDIGATTAGIQKTGGRVIVPEPATLLFGLCGLAAITLRRPRR